MGATEHNRIPEKKKSIRQTIKDYLLITISCIIYSVAVSLFLDPNSLAPGGVTGIAIILNRLIPVETGTLILLINIPILLLGTWKFGIRFSLSTIYSTVLISLFTNLFASVEVVTRDPLCVIRSGHVHLPALGVLGGQLVAADSGACDF